MKPPTLFIFSGLPASGKSTLAQELTRKINATFLRVDTIEQGLADVCKYKVEGGEGYELSHRIAGDNLKLGNSVIADSVNPWAMTRAAWNEVAKSNQANFVNIEVICSDREEHKQRAETKITGIKNLKPPTWEGVLQRDYHPWTEPRLLIDTAGKKVSDSVEELIQKLKLS